MSLRDELERAHPGFPLLSLERPEGVAELLAALGWLDDGERIEGCEPAGEGNMNLTVRVRTTRRSLVLKQSRPWVEKYDWIAAPFDRARVERAFYRRVAGLPEVAARMPKLLAADAETRTLLLEDLGEAADLTHLYRGGSLAAAAVKELGAYLRGLHAGTRGAAGDGTDDRRLRNREMRALNHRHLIRVPLDPENGVDLEALEPGLAAVAARLRADEALAEALEALGERYLADGPVLVHGDYFPGSWLETASGLRVIDPEFCAFADPELDLGVAAAHLVLARQPLSTVDALVAQATAPPPAPAPDRALIARFAGMEIIRRLIGVAQLPIPPSDGFRAAALLRARSAVLEGDLEALRS